jgi:hypothetical protein
MPFCDDVYIYFAGTGNYLYLLETNRRSDYSAKMKVPFMDTTGKCLLLFYEIFGENPGTIIVETVDVCGVLPSHKLYV